MDEPKNKHYKKRGGKKPFVIERRYVGRGSTWCSDYWESMREWHVHRRYKTEKARAKALENFTSKFNKYWEYRNG